MAWALKKNYKKNWPGHKEENTKPWTRYKKKNLVCAIKKKMQNPGPGPPKKKNLVWGKLISHHAKSLKDRQVLKNHWQCIVESCVHCILVLVTTNGLYDHR